MDLLNRIEQPEDLRKLSEDQLPELADQLRRFIIEALSVKAGHLGASLGTVELSIGLHYVFNTPTDSLIWDVGHQAYGHKILTGRRAVFNTNRQWGGISGFPKRAESPYDSFGTGHSSTAISAALGMAIADPNNTHIAVVGDAAIGSGMAFEGLNHAGATQANLLLILNDNHMGIDPSVGALKAHFEDLGTAKNNLFEALGFDYSGPIDGHNLSDLIRELQRLKNISGPRVLHIKTLKGKGLAAAELDQITYHAPGTFDRKTGRIHQKPSGEKFQDVVGATLKELMEEDSSIYAISPAMTTGSGLSALIKQYPNRVLDVGIAEQHALTLAGGMATKGQKPFCVIYSTFLQRAIDQLIHDIALQKLAVVLCIDRAGLVGNDGATHQGVFDIALLRSIPNLIITAPKDANELRDLMHFAKDYTEGPIAIRYPRGNVFHMDWNKAIQPIALGKGQCLKEGERIALITTGISAHTALKAVKSHKTIAHYHFPFIKPLDEALIAHIGTHFQKLITLEDGALQGGFGEAVSSSLVRQGICKEVIHLGVPDEFIEQGTPLEQQKAVQLDYNHLNDLLNQL